MENFQVYRDIQARTGGDIYIGVVGPVRTGKSTFIRRFMELVALPQMSDTKQAEIRDQLPLSGSGKIITTAETKFIPKESSSHHSRRRSAGKDPPDRQCGFSGKGCIRADGGRERTNGKNSLV